jgi:hypothetical protein
LKVRESGHLPEWHTGKVPFQTRLGLAMRGTYAATHRSNSLMAAACSTSPVCKSTAC